jgi:hypothetical protein
MLLYADDVVFLCENENYLQKMLENTGKTQIKSALLSITFPLKCKTLQVKIPLKCRAP